MKKILLAIGFLFALAVGAQAQTNCVELREIDGTPDVKCVKVIKVTNGTLACTGSTCTLTISGGGGGSPGGADTNVQYNDSGSFGGNSGFIYDKTSKISLGVAGTSVGAVAFKNATSGTITLQAITGALGTVTLSLPAATDTLVGKATTDTLTNKTLTTPTIGDFSNANHNHSNSAGGGQVAISSGISGLGTGVATFLGTPSSANFLSAITNETGSGLVMGNDTPTIITPSFTTGFTIGGVAATGTIPRGNGTNFIASTFTVAAPGTSGNVLTSDGTNWTSAAPAGGGITVGTTTITSGANTKVLFNNSGVVGEYTISGTGNVMMSASPTTTGTLTAGAATLSDVISLTSTTAANNKITQGAAINIGTTSTDGIILQNTTAAAAGAQQYSPRLHFIGQGWKTNATAASQTVDWIVENQPVQGAANPTTNLSFSSQVNAGGYTERATITSGGLVQATKNGGYAIGIQVGGQNFVGIGRNASVGGLNLNGGTGSDSDGTAQMLVQTTGVTLDSTFAFGWASTNVTQSRDTGLARLAAGVIRATNGSTGAGSLVIGTSTVGSIGTSGVGVLAIANGTAPTSSPADEFQLYGADAAAGASEAWIRNEAGEITPISGLASRNSAQFDKTSSTTLAAVTGLTRNVAASRTYGFTAVVQTTAAATGGVKFSISGTATATAISYEGKLEGGAAIIAQTRSTALDGVVCASTTATAGTCTITGVIQVNAAGTLTVNFAQNSSDGTASSVLANQLFYLIPIG